MQNIFLMWAYPCGSGFCGVPYFAALRTASCRRRPPYPLRLEVCGDFVFQ